MSLSDHNLMVFNPKKTVTKITNRKHAKKHTNILIPEIADWFYKPVNAIHYNWTLLDSNCVCFLCLWKMIAINFINGFCEFNTVVIAQEQNFSNLSHNNGRNWCLLFKVSRVQIIFQKSEINYISVELSYFRQLESNYTVRNCYFL